jgi:hypothetical protein
MPKGRTLGLIGQIRYDPVTTCWNWTGQKTKDGYGKKWFQNRHISVHRLAAHLWLRFDLASPLYVLHRCDNPACFNPKHLFIGTQKDNAKDCSRKNRYFNMRKTHCIRGHEFTEENTYIPRSTANRHCRECRRLREEQRRKRG